MPRHRRLRAAALLATAGLATALAAFAAEPEACLRLFRKGMLTLPFNPAFLHVAEVGPDGRAALMMSSFFNVERAADGEKVTRVFERDLVAWIPDLDGVDLAKFDPATQLEVLTDRAGPPYKEVWPNESDVVPEGVLPFNAVVVPGGFLATPKAGRFTIVNIDDPARPEYVVAAAGTATPDCSGGVVRNDRWFYHQALFHDMDGDGLKDIVTARANLMPFMYKCPFVGELIYFRNPGKDLKPDVPWEVRVLAGLPDEKNGPEVNLDLADLEGDGVPEIIATHFFTSDNITVFGAPAGGQWADFNPAAGRPLRRATVMTGQGRPFAVEAVDLNGDGRLEILTSNHQGDGCFDVTADKIPGRVIALQPPASGRLFEDPWTTHILKDNIRPNPTVPVPARGPGRLAPNRAVAFWPIRWLEKRVRPWILVGGDEASRVWILKPASQREDDWTYESFTIFDINDHYGPGTTQTIRTDDPKGEVISTIGGVAWRYDRPGAWGFAEIYVPVFEARQIHVFTFRAGPFGGSKLPRVNCPPDVTLACPAT
jgi:hypothetical protein